MNAKNASNANMDKFGETLARACADRGLSVDYVAKCIGVDEHTVRSWIFGYVLPSRRSLAALIAVLDPVDLVLLQAYWIAEESQPNRKDMLDWGYSEEHVDFHTWVDRVQSEWPSALELRQPQLALIDDDKNTSRRTLVEALREDEILSTLLDNAVTSEGDRVLLSNAYLEYSELENKLYVMKLDDPCLIQPVFFPCRTSTLLKVDPEKPYASLEFIDFRFEFFYYGFKAEMFNHAVEMMRDAYALNGVTGSLIQDKHNSDQVGFDLLAAIRRSKMFNPLINSIGITTVYEEYVDWLEQYVLIGVTYSNVGSVHRVTFQVPVPLSEEYKVRLTQYAYSKIGGFKWLNHDPEVVVEVVDVNIKSDVPGAPLPSSSLPIEYGIKVLKKARKKLKAEKRAVSTKLIEIENAIALIESKAV